MALVKVVCALKRERMSAVKIQKKNAKEKHTFEKRSIMGSGKIDFFFCRNLIFITNEMEETRTL